MAITPQPGYIIDPNNPNGVIKDPNAVIGIGGVPVAPSLPIAQAPTNVSNVNTGIKSPVIPASVPSSGNISNAVAATAGSKNFYETVAKRQDALAAEQKANAKPFLDKLIGSPNPAEARAAATAQTGINPTEYFTEQKAKIAEIETLTSEYNAAVANRDQQIAALTGQGRGIPIDLLNNQAAQIERNAAPKLAQLSSNISTKTAVLKALQGNFAEATDFINQAVADATSDTKFNLDMYMAFSSLNADSISRLDTTYQKAIDASLAAAQNEHEENVKNKTAVGNLILSNPLAGITMNDTYEEAVTKAAANPSPSSSDTQVVEAGGRKLLIDSRTGQVVRDLGSVNSGGTGIASSGFLDTKTEASVRQDAVSLLNDVDAGALTIEKAYQRLRTLYSTNEVSDEALKSLLGMDFNVSEAATGNKASSFKTPVFSGFGGSTPAYFSSDEQQLSDNIYSFLFQ